MRTQRLSEFMRIPINLTPSRKIQYLPAIPAPNGVYAMDDLGNLTDFISGVETFFDSQIARGITISTFVGAIMILMGFGLKMISWFYRRSGEPVTIKVVDIQDYIAKSRDSTSTKMFRPEFLIETGSSRGERMLASSASSDCKHRIGEVTTGYLFASRDEIASERQLKEGSKFGLIFILAGIGTIILFRLFQ